MNEIPMAKPDPDAIWPVQNENHCDWTLYVPTRGSSAFGATRANGRRTVGVTLWSSQSRFVRALLDARYVRACRWTQDAWIVYLLTENYFIGLGGLLKHSLTTFERNEFVGRGDDIGATGADEGGSARLHFSMYARPEGLTGSDFAARAAAGEFVWRGEPSQLLVNPTEFLQDIAQRMK